MLITRHLLYSAYSHHCEVHSHIVFHISANYDETNKYSTQSMIAHNNDLEVSAALNVPVTGADTEATTL